MKKTSLLIASILISIISFSQIEKPITKGSIILSGGGSIQKSFMKGDVSSHIFKSSISPGFGYFICKNLAVGINTKYDFSNIDSWRSKSI